MRWLLLKDLRIMRRSPLLTGILVVYPIAIALMIGLAVSSPPGKPKVAFYSAVAPGHGRIHFGSQEIDISSYAKQLFKAIQPVKVDSRAQALAAVRAGRVLAALIVPADVAAQVQSLVTQGVGSPTVQVVLNSSDPLERQFVQQAIQSQLNLVEQAVSKQVLKVAVDDLRLVLVGGAIDFAGQKLQLLGLRDARTIIDDTISALPAGSGLVPGLRQVSAFAQLASVGLGFASPVLGSIGTPLTVEQTELKGRSTPTATYAAVIAAVVSMMLVALLLAAGMLALERSENAYSRLVRGLVAPWALLIEKIVLAALCAAALTLALVAVVSAFVHLDWARFELWALALGVAALAFGALGAAIGGLTRDVSAASLLAFLLSLPVAFVALVPASAVSGAVHEVLAVVSFAFPFRAALDAVENAFTGSAPGIVLPLVHLAGLAAAFWGLGLLGLRRFAR
jgi:ABC-2 type transport system permease protein